MSSQCLQAFKVKYPSNPCATCKDFEKHTCPKYWVEKVEGHDFPRVTVFAGTFVVGPHLRGVCEAPDWYKGSCPRQIVAGNDAQSHQDKYAGTGVNVL